MRQLNSEIFARINTEDLALMKSIIEKDMKAITGKEMMFAQRMVLKFGEKHRQIIVSALAWLDEEEPKWKLSKPIDREEFLRGIIQDPR